MSVKKLGLTCVEGGGPETGGVGPEGWRGSFRGIAVVSEGPDRPNAGLGFSQVISGGPTGRWGFTQHWDKTGDDHQILLDRMESCHRHDVSVWRCFCAVA